MSERKTYRVVCPELDVILNLKGLVVEEEMELYNQLREKIRTEAQPIKFDEYKTFIVRKFLIDVDAFFELFPDDDIELMQEGVDAAYEAIIRMYPPFSLNFICEDLNSETFFRDPSNSNTIARLKEHLLGVAQRDTEDNVQLPVALSSIEELKRLEEYLLENIVGQEAAIKSLMRSLKLMASGLSGQSSFLFVGPTGVGKTQLAKLLGEKFSGNFYKINCAEYAGGHEYAKLIGSPPGYVGHTEKSLLAEKAEKSNSWVFLFDEIEKAHHKLYDFLLSLLDDGTCTDNMGQVLDFSQSIFIFTSNQGVGEIKRESVGFMSSKEEVSDSVSESVIKKSIKRHFSPEFLNRIDDTVVFKPLSKKDVKDIAALHLEKLPIMTTHALVEFVADKGYSREYGARNIARFIKNNVSDKVADAILNELIPKNGDEFYKPRIVRGEVKIIDTEKYNVSSV
jgi:ATP-dependent Clp protease ATP-binding subunit ClpA